MRFKLFPHMDRNQLTRHLKRCARHLRNDGLHHRFDGASLLTAADAMAHLVGGGLVEVGSGGLVAHMVAPGSHWLSDMDGYRLHLLIAEAIGLVHDCINNDGAACGDCWEAALDVTRRGLAPEGAR